MSEPMIDPPRTNDVPPLPHLTGPPDDRRKPQFPFLVVVALLGGGVLFSVGFLFLRVVMSLTRSSIPFVSTATWAVCLSCLLIGGYMIVRSLQGFVRWSKQQKESAA